MLDVNTINGSRVTAKIAGIESTAKKMSVVSITSKERNSGVIKRLPFSFKKNAWPSILVVIGKNYLASLTTVFWLKSCSSSSFEKSIFKAEKISKAPNTYIIHSK